MQKLSFTSNKLLKTQFLLTLLFIASLQAYSQGVTTAVVKGLVRNNRSEPIPGASILIIHQPTGTQFGTTADGKGYFAASNLHIGGPYTLRVTAVGYHPHQEEGLFLSLGQNLQLEVFLIENVQLLSEIVVKSSPTGDDARMNANRTGAATTISRNQIENLPTITRDLNDYLRLTPSASVRADGGISFAGLNSRYNSIYIDGAVNNDVFGLSTSGTNGGQTGITPVSIDAIETFQVLIAPYDVRYGGFGGGSVNAVTRSGSNRLSGSVYYLTRNEKLAGKTPTDQEGVARTRLSPFTSRIAGFRLGGPIVRNKWFFFVNGELLRQQTPRPFSFATYRGNATIDTVNAIADQVRQKYGYEPGDILNNIIESNSDKLFVRLDGNLGKHQLKLRHNYTLAERIGPQFQQGNNNIYFRNYYQQFTSITHSSAVEVKSTFTNVLSNDLILGYTRVRDDAKVLGTPFPYIEISDGPGNIRLGSEPFSTTSRVSQDIYTLTDNLYLNAGKHTFTFGTHNEFFSVFNGFIPYNYGYYAYPTVNAFFQNRPSGYLRGYSLIADKVGDANTEVAADFTTIQLGLYAQDEFSVTSRLRLTAGLRFDLPVFPDKPRLNSDFNATTLPEIEQFYDLHGAQSGKLPQSRLLFSPRIGFNYDVKGNKTLLLRGGTGVFTSRMPLVWLGGAFLRNGINQTVLVNFNLPAGFGFRPEVDNQYTASSFGRQEPIPSGDVDILAENLSFPQFLKTSLGLDMLLPLGVTGSLDLTYSNTLHNVKYNNVNLKPATETLRGADNRPLFTNGKVDGRYSKIIYIENTNKGHSFNVDARLQKSFDMGLQFYLAYSYGRSRVVNEATASLSTLVWDYIIQDRGRNDAPLSFSENDLGSRLIGSLQYRKEYLKKAATGVSLVYRGQSGQRFSYVYSGSLNGEGVTGANGDLLYVPATPSDIQFTGSSEEQLQQWQDLNAFIEQDKYLRKRRGQYAQANGGRTPFEHVVDARLMQEFFLQTAKQKHTLQVTLDVFNFTNLLNKNWGRRYYTTAYNKSLPLLRFRGYRNAATGDYTPLFSFQKPTDNPWEINDVGVNSARWQAQLGVRYSF